MSMYWILFIGIAIISYIVQASLQSKFKKYSKMPLSNGMTGKEVAEKMLHDNGIYDVRVTSTPGMLTDHYNPANKTVNLSEGVYGSNSVAAAAVAAHECGHAAACACIRSVENAFCTCSGGSVLIFYHDLGVVGRNSDGKYFSAVIVGRYLFVCHDYPLQFYYITGRNKCEPSCTGMVE